jgi:LEA14-like dessication related protein
LKNFIKYSFLFLLALSLFSCLQYKEVQIIKVTDVGIKDVSTKAIDIEVAMQIKNPNKYDISIVDSDLTLFLKGKKLGTANIKEKIKLKKKSNEIHRFVIQSNLKDIASGVIPIIMGLMTKDSIELEVKGDIKAKAKGISKKVPIDFKEKVKL